MPHGCRTTSSRAGARRANTAHRQNKNWWPGCADAPRAVPARRTLVWRVVKAARRSLRRQAGETGLSREASFEVLLAAPPEECSPGGLLRGRPCSEARALARQQRPRQRDFLAPSLLPRPFGCPSPTPSLAGGPTIRSRLLDAPARAARAVKPSAARVWNHERGTSKRRGTRRAVALAVLHRRRVDQGARRGAPAETVALLFPPGVVRGFVYRPPRRARGAPLTPTQAAGRAPTSTACGCSHTNF